jgi:hypothetical protein
VVSSHSILFTFVITRVEFGTARHVIPPSVEVESEVVVAASSLVTGGAPAPATPTTPGVVSINPLSPPIKNGTCPVVSDPRPYGTIVFTFSIGTLDITAPTVRAVVFAMVTPRCAWSS